MPPPPPTNMPPAYQPYQYANTPQFAPWGTRVGGHLINGLVAAIFAVPAFAAFFAVPKEITALHRRWRGPAARAAHRRRLGIVVAVALAGSSCGVIIGAMVARTGQAWGHEGRRCAHRRLQHGGNISAGKRSSATSSVTPSTACRASSATCGRCGTSRSRPSPTRSSAPDLDHRSEARSRSLAR